MVPLGRGHFCTIVVRASGSNFLVLVLSEMVRVLERTQITYPIFVHD
jgi:hypothetical protein